MACANSDFRGSSEMEPPRVGKRLLFSPGQLADVWNSTSGLRCCQTPCLVVTARLRNRDFSAIRCDISVSTSYHASFALIAGLAFPLVLFLRSSSQLRLGIRVCLITCIVLFVRSSH
jgi:hypothetical protein